MFYHIFLKFVSRCGRSTAEAVTECKDQVLSFSIHSYSNLPYLFDILKFNVRFCVFLMAYHFIKDLQTIMLHHAASAGKNPFKVGFVFKERQKYCD